MAVCLARCLSTAAACNEKEGRKEGRKEEGNGNSVCRRIGGQSNNRSGGRSVCCSTYFFFLDLLRPFFPPFCLRLPSFFTAFSFILIVLSGATSRAKLPRVSGRPAGSSHIKDDWSDAIALI